MQPDLRPAARDSRSPMSKILTKSNQVRRLLLMSKLPGSNGRGEATGRPLNPVVERGTTRSPPGDLRDPATRTPQSDYQMALQTQPGVRRNPKRDPYPLPPVPVRSSKPSKSRDSRVFIKPPRFEGKDNCIESHLVQFEIIAKRNRWDEHEKADFLKCSLSGEASHMLRDLRDEATYDDVVCKTATTIWLVGANRELPYGTQTSETKVG